jgi:hypothetical protein
MRYIEGIDRKRKIAYPDYIDEYVTEDNPVRVSDSTMTPSISNKITYSIISHPKKNKYFFGIFRPWFSRP